MAEPRDYQTEAIIIKKTKLGEADRILTLYTPHLGKIQAVAKGVRRPRSKMSGHLELITHSQISLARGHNLDTVTGTQTIDSFLPIKNDLWLTSCALYITEMVCQFTAEHDENYPLFQLMNDTLHTLSVPCNIELLLRYFEMQLLNKVGYMPQLHNCPACRSPLRVGINAFSTSDGGILCPECSQNRPVTYPLSVNAIKVMRVFQTDDYATASRLKVNNDLIHEIDEVMSPYIEYLLERKLKTVVWLNVLRDQIKSTPTIKTTEEPLAELSTNS